MKWFSYLSGGTNYNLDDPQVQNLIRSITNAANAQWTNLITSPGRTYLWADASSTTDSSDITGAYSHILDMARGFATWGGALYTNAALGADIRSALDWMYVNRYNETKVKFDNWWDWEIGSPMSLNDACVLLYDTLSAGQLANYSRAIALPRRVRGHGARPLTWSPAMNEPTFLNGTWEVDISSEPAGARFYRLWTP